MTKEKLIYVSLIGASTIVIIIAIAFVYYPLINNLLNPGNSDKTSEKVQEIEATKSDSKDLKTTTNPSSTITPTPAQVIAPSQTPTPIPVVVLKDFTSTKYPISFKYPETIGEAKVESKSDYFNDEFVTFTNSSITIQYPIFEGGVVGKQFDLFESNSSYFGKFTYILSETSSDSTDKQLFMSVKGAGIRQSITLFTQQTLNNAQKNVELDNLRVIAKNLVNGL
jgi:hypothetical protein